MSRPPITNERILQRTVAAIDAALDLRVSLHQEREEKRITVPEYLAGLEAVRLCERALEPLRSAPHSRAYELSVGAMEGSGSDLASRTQA